MSGDVINVQKTSFGKVTEVIGEVSPPIFAGYGLYNLLGNIFN